MFLYSHKSDKRNNQFPSFLHKIFTSKFPRTFFQGKIISDDFFQINALSMKRSYFNRESNSG